MAKDRLDAMRRSAMARSFSWDLSAARYGARYQKRLRLPQASGLTSLTRRPAAAGSIPMDMAPNELPMIHAPKVRRRSRHVHASACGRGSGTISQIISKARRNAGEVCGRLIEAVAAELVALT